MTKLNGISKAFINDFTKRFKSKNHRINLELFDFIPCITKEENKELKKVVTEEKWLLNLK